ncbi:MAG: DNA repair protein RecO [Alphaproteobacteria bacterium]|jgi:DNA repair protein RecO (recombination protein O)|nr:DNA repair protein RecO [Alphaproteobacteria bacterium]MBT5389319.1 DNA repair protein RecO [Alphaproteobacteria bacterium]MBT5540946.1 DNA repair protein RecO [Alphaproteobacteria bacterium]MBT5654937.1 DNA repair protein RecO [Alphaproteobacteria bacterium]
MDWRDEGFILRTTKHGETSLLVSILTKDHGRHMGITRKSRSSKMSSGLQLGNRTSVEWKARLPEHLGTWKLETISSPFSALMDQPGPLTALTSALSLCDSVLPERESLPCLFQQMSEVVSALSSPTWLQAYIRFEVHLLKELGFSLDLEKCAVTKEVENLTYVSPKTGCAVTKETGEPYKDRLFPLPAFLGPAYNDSKEISDTEYVQGLQLTGYFLEKCVLSTKDLSLPSSRHRLMGYVR